MFKIALAVVVGGALVCVSDPASARFRIRIPAAATKPAAVQAPKPAAAVPASSRPSVGVFVGVPLRPFAAAPREAPAQRATPALAEQAGARDIGAAAANDQPPAPTGSNVTGKEPAQDKEPAKAQAAMTPPANEPAKVQPAPPPARLASTSVRVVNHKARPAHAPVYCYVQPSGACVPF